jgi:hypothetical protein
MPVAKSVVYELDAHRQSNVYTLDMPKFVFVQTTGIERPAKIRADKVEKTKSDEGFVLSIKLGNEQIGEFRSPAVQGWWIEEEPESR